MIMFSLQMHRGWIYKSPRVDLYDKVSKIIIDFYEIGDRVDYSDVDAAPTPSLFLT